MSCATTEFLTERITKTKALIEAYEDAVLSLGSGTQEYRLDTGQTVTHVTKADVKDLNATLDSLYNRLATLCARRDGSGVLIGRPGF